MTVPDRSTFENIYAGQPPWEIGRFPSLEVYGHACEDPSKAETTILIGLTGANVE
jgi:hypothetical protein